MAGWCAGKRVHRLFPPTPPPEPTPKRPPGPDPNFVRSDLPHHPRPPGRPCTRLAGSDAAADTARAPAAPHRRCRRLRPHPHRPHTPPGTARRPHRPRPPARGHSTGREHRPGTRRRRADAGASLTPPQPRGCGAALGGRWSPPPGSPPPGRSDGTTPTRRPQGCATPLRALSPPTRTGQNPSRPNDEDPHPPRSCTTTRGYRRS